jgi:transitional endoplasmic reticulum ATPase
LHIDVGLPDEAARRSIFEIHLRGRPVEAEVSAEMLAFGTQGWSGAQIAEWCRRAALRAVARAIATGDALLILADDFAAALEASDTEHGF